MRIAHVVDSMDVGGAEVLVSQMCRLQRACGEEPSVYAISTLGALGEQLRQEGFLVQPHLGRDLLDGTRNLYRVFRHTRPDVVHLHNPTPTIYGAIAARLAGVRSIVSTRHSLVAKPRRASVELKYAVAATCCDWVVGICDATVNNLKSIHSIPPRKIVRVYNGAAPLTRVPPDQCPPKDGFTLLFVGRLEPVKNHALLLQAFSAAQDRAPGLRLWMVGDGSQRKKLEDLARDLGISACITFWGQQLDVAPFYSAADAFIMSSMSEGLPMSLLQAFSLGLPTIVTDVGGMAEAVRLANAGFTLSVADPVQMAAAILRLAGSDAEQKQFSMNARTAFESWFMLQTMVDAYMGLYRKTIRAQSCAKA